MKINTTTLVIVTVAAFAIGVGVGRFTAHGVLGPPITATITFNGGNCQQSPAASIPVGSNQQVEWSGSGASDDVVVTFHTSGASGPFRNQSYSTRVLTGAPTGPPGAYPFLSVTVNGQACNNPGEMGVHVN
jgi:hypothetical protein